LEKRYNFLKQFLEILYILRLHHHQFQLFHIHQHRRQQLLTNRLMTLQQVYRMQL
jgi:hypothetical protein